MDFYKIDPAESQESKFFSCPALFYSIKKNVQKLQLKIFKNIGISRKRDNF